jgi:hypothetical protein
LNVSLDTKFPSSASDVILVTKATLTVGVRGGGRDHVGGPVTVVLRQLMASDDDAGVALDAISVAGDEDVTLDASAAVQQWLLAPEDNHGLVVECVGCQNNDGVEIVVPNGGADIDIQAKTLRR